MQDELLSRIDVNPRVMTGKPVIRGTRLTVPYILRLLAFGASLEEILRQYEGIAPEDVKACLLYASEGLEKGSFVPAE